MERMTSTLLYPDVQGVLDAGSDLREAGRRLTIENGTTNKISVMLEWFDGVARPND